MSSSRVLGLWRDPPRNLTGLISSLKSSSPLAQACYSTLKVVQKDVAPEIPQSPLSSLPNTVLLRSLMINTVSSKPYLLGPSLAIMSFLSNPKRGAFFNPDRNFILHWILKGTFYKQFCTGETTLETRAKMDEFKSMGFRGTILTFARETTESEGAKDVNANAPCPSIEGWRKSTLVSAGLLQDGDQLAIKLTGAGPRVNKALAANQLPSQQMMDALYEIAMMCKARGARIIVDAESQEFQAGIDKVAMHLMEKYNREGSAMIFNTYQAYLKGTPRNIANHLAQALESGFTHGLKLVRGAYLSSEVRSLVHDTKQDTDDCYDSIIKGALQQEFADFGGQGSKPFPSVNLLLASHNKKSIMAAYDMYQRRIQANLPTVPVGFAQLQGMSDEVSFTLLQLINQDDPSAPEVYKCSTWGTLGECIAYLGRRAFENRDAASRTQDEYNALKSEAWRRLKATMLLRN